MPNAISAGPDSFNVTGGAQTINFGSGPNQVPLPNLLLNSASGAVTFNLPPINTTQPVPPGTPAGVVGVGDGFELTIKNISGNGITLQENTAAGDTKDGPSLATAGAVNQYKASATLKKWLLISAG